jgi:alpha-tubulin suppressor-like RCC1 family protein
MVLMALPPVSRAALAQFQTTGNFMAVTASGLLSLPLAQSDTTPPTVTVSVSPPPDSQGLNLINPVDHFVMVTLTAHDTDSGIASLTYSTTGIYQIPLTTINNDTQQFNLNIEGVTTIAYQAADNAGNVSPLQNFTVKLQWPVPVASNQSVSLNEDTSQAVKLVGTIPFELPLIYHLLTSPAHGSLSGTTPNLVYSPTTNYTGSDSFTFQVYDPTLNRDSNIATVSLTVHPVNDPPTVYDQQIRTIQNVAKSFHLIGYDVESAPLTYALASMPFHGSLSGTPPNLTYTPKTDYIGSDSFTYKANDGSFDSNMATVALFVQPPLPDKTVPLVYRSGTEPSLGEIHSFARYPFRLEDIAAIAADRGSFALILKKDGTVWAWGTNNHGQLGIGIISNTDAYLQSPVQVSDLTDVVAIDMGYRHAIALKSDGTVWTWGDNGNGQLGDGRISQISSSPIQVVGLTDVKAIAAGGDTSLALKTDGTVWSWGNNIGGLLGDGNSDFSWRGSPVQVKGLTNVTAIDVGLTTSLAAKSDGTVWIWGLINTKDGYTSSYVPIQVQGLEGVTAVSASEVSVEGNNLALKSDGTVWVWGGAGVGFNVHDAYLPQQVSGLTDMTAISSGKNNSLALKSDGTLWTFGQNNVGQLGLGDGSTAYQYLPSKVPGLTGVSGIAGAADRSLALAQVMDTVPPVVTGTVDPAPNALGWNTSDVIFTLTSSDAESFVKSVEYATIGAQPQPLATINDVNANFPITAEGITTVTYQATDAAGNVSAPQTFLVKINKTPPIASDQTTTLNEDASQEITLNASDPGVGEPLIYTVSTPPSHGILSGAAPNLTYTPAADYFGNDRFTFIASDGSFDSNTATVTLNVLSINDAPVAQDQSVETLRGRPLELHLQASDVESDPLTYEVVALPQHGTLSGTPPALIYTPEAGYSGSDLLTFKTNDSAADSSLATVSIAVQIPLLEIGQVAGFPGTSVTIPIAVTELIPSIKVFDLTLDVTAPPGAPALTPTFYPGDQTAGWPLLADPNNPWHVSLASANGIGSPAQLLRLNVQVDPSTAEGTLYSLSVHSAAYSDASGQTLAVASTDTVPGRLEVIACVESAIGDVNHDGNVSLGDAILALRMAVGIDLPPNLCVKTAADINCDGKVQLSDVSAILRKGILGIEFTACSE